MTTTQGIEIKQFLRFELDHQFYGLDVLKTREVLSSVHITPLPNSLNFLSGVINLRGSVIPVIDLRKKFSLPEVEPTIDTSIIIVELATQQETIVVGALVDAVKDVVLCESKDLEPAPRFGMKLNANLVQAISKKDGVFVILLDSDKLFSEDELWLVKSQSDEEHQASSETVS